MTTKELLRRSAIFASLPDEDLDRLIQLGEPLIVCAGDVLMTEGSPGGSVQLALEGEYDITKRSGQRDVVLARRGPGEIFGEISLFDESPRTASVRAIGDGRLLEFSQTAFQQALFANPPALLAMLRTITARLRNTESMLRQSEKMASLGTLAAGVAHELNNPAAAAQRAAARLRGALAEWYRLNLGLSALALEGDQLAAVYRLRDDVDQRRAQQPLLDPLARSDREAEVETWLEARGVESAWEIASTLVAAGWDPTVLDRLTDDIAPAQLAVVARWLAASSTVDALVAEVGESAHRISEIVKAVKAYSYLDQAPVQDVDVREGIENTLVFLRHKLNGIKVTRDYAADLPRIEAFGSELNQVWTNLLDNAADALQGTGEIGIRACKQEKSVVVQIVDNGPGIPPELQSRIFDPFFTTKPPGVGTGLGLHITYNIVAQKHRGQIGVISRPGATVFQVTLPIRMKSDA